MLVPEVYEFLAEVVELVNRLRIRIRWLRKVYSLTHSETSLVEAHCSVEMPVFDDMIGSWHPIQIICHFLREHFEPTICGVFVFLLARNFPHYIIKSLP